MLPTLRDALERLVVSNGVVVPQIACMKFQLVQSPSLARYHDVSRTNLAEGIQMARSQNAADCIGGRCPFPLRLAGRDDVTFLTPPQDAFTVNFQLPFGLDEVQGRIVRVVAETGGSIDAVVAWWDLTLWKDVATYTTKEGCESWQDHWLPLVTGLAGRDLHVVQKGDVVEMSIKNTELQFAFELLSIGGHMPLGMMEFYSEILKRGNLWDPEPCGCGWHVLCTPERLESLNTASRMSLLQNAVQQVVQSFPNAATATCLDVTDGSVMGLAAASFGMGQTLLLETQQYSAWLLRQVIERATLSSRVHVMQHHSDWPENRDDDDCISGEEGGAEQQQQYTRMMVDEFNPPRINLHVGEP